MFPASKEDLKATLTLAWPIIIGQLGTVLMGVADTIMVGRLSAADLAAAGFSNAVYFFITIFPIGFYLVVAPMISAAQSAGNFGECGRLYSSIWWHSYFQAGGCMLLLAIPLLFFDRLGQTPEVAEKAIGFYIILLFSTWPLTLFIGLKQVTDGLSMPNVSMFVTLGGLSLNVFLNWLFIYGNAGFPAWGLNGAGYATLISRCFMAVGLWAFIQISPKTRPILVPFKWYKEEIKKIFSIGIPSGFQFFYEVAAFCVAAVIMGWLGTYELAAHHVAINIASITYMVSAGIGTAGSIRVGNALGEGNKTALKLAAGSAYLITISFMFVTCLVMLFCSSWLVSLYNDDPGVLRLGKQLVVIAGFFQLSDGIQSVSLSVLRAISDVKLPSFITLAAYWIIGLPLGYVLGFPFGMGVVGIWIGLLAGLTLSATFLTIRFYRQIS